MTFSGRSVSIQIRIQQFERQFASMRFTALVQLVVFKISVAAAGVLRRIRSMLASWFGSCSCDGESGVSIGASQSSPILGPALEHRPLLLVSKLSTVRPAKELPHDWMACARAGA